MKECDGWGGRSPPDSPDKRSIQRCSHTSTIHKIQYNTIQDHSKNQSLGHSPVNNGSADGPSSLHPPFFRPSHAHPLRRHARFFFWAQVLLAARSFVPLQPPFFRPSHTHPLWRHFFLLNPPHRPSRVDSPAATTVGSSQLPLHMQPDFWHVFRLLRRGHVRGSARLLHPASAP